MCIVCVPFKSKGVKGTRWSRLTVPSEDISVRPLPPEVGEEGWTRRGGRGADVGTDEEQKVVIGDVLSPLFRKLLETEVG